ncbi:signal peptidase II [Candidatus Omnitrophota bacterium]
MIAIIVGSILLLDQVTKSLALKNLALGKSLPVIKGILHLTLVTNQGAAFGIFKGQSHLFIISALVAAILIISLLKKNKCRLTGISFSLILAGALGNLIDRIYLGFVVDFIDLRFWPVFNLADSSITIGAVLLGITVLKRKGRV